MIAGSWEWRGSAYMHMCISLAYAPSGKMETEVPEEGFRDDVAVVGRQIRFSTICVVGGHWQLLLQHNDK